MVTVVWCKRSNPREAECVNEVAQLEISHCRRWSRLASEGRFPSWYDGGVRERGSFIAGGQGSLFAADRRSTLFGSAAMRFWAAFHLTSKFVIQTVECFGKNRAA